MLGFLAYSSKKYAEYLEAIQFMIFPMMLLIFCSVGCLLLGMGPTFQSALFT